MHDLLSGIDDENALVRAEALGYDLGQPHRVVLVEWSTKTQTEDAALHAVRRALRELRLTALLGTQSGVIVMLVGGRGGAPVDWEALRAASLRELGGGRCRLTVGGLYKNPSELPGSLREAQLALRLQKASGQTEQTTVYGELGVFQMFASMPDLGDIENFARRWLHALIDYDEAKGTDLVKTLGATWTTAGVTRQRLWRSRFTAARSSTACTASGSSPISMSATRRRISTCSWRPGPGPHCRRCGTECPDG